MATPDTVLLELGRQFGIEGLAFSKDGLCELVFDGQLRTVTSCVDQGWIVAVQLHSHPLPAGDPTLDRALRANFLWRGGCGATLALDDEMRLWAQKRIENQDAGAQNLLRALESLLDLADAWRSGASTPPRPARAERDHSLFLNRA